MTLDLSCRLPSVARGLALAPESVCGMLAMRQARAMHVPTTSPATCQACARSAGHRYETLKRRNTKTQKPISTGDGAVRERTLRAREHGRTDDSCVIPKSRLLEGDTPCEIIIE